MPGAYGTSAEEFYSRCINQAQVLERTCREHADRSDVVAAVAAALGADISSLQSLIWERINIAPRVPQRQFFQAGEALTAALVTFGSEPLPSDSSAAQVIRQYRARMGDSFDSALAADASHRWPDISCLEQLAAPTTVDLDESVDRRLGGLTALEFVSARRAGADTCMTEAQARRIRGAISEAIGSAFESDFLALEAYLVESAIAAGDVRLLTVTIRWDLAAHAVSQMAGLPDHFADAVAAIREAMVGGLGDADGARLLSTLTAV